MNTQFILRLIKSGIFALLLTLFIVDKQFYFPFVGLKGVYFMVVAETVFFLWLVLALRWKKYRLNIKNPVIASVAAFLAVSFSAALLGPNFSTSFWSDFERMAGVLMLFHLAAVCVVSSLVFEARDWKWFFCASVAMASIIGVEALFNSDPNARAGGFIGNDSFLGSYLLFNIFIALYLAISRKYQDSKWLRLSALVAFAVLSFCLLFEGTQFWASLLAKNPQLPEAGLFRDIIGAGARAAKVSLAGGLTFLGLLWLSFRKNFLKNIGRAMSVVFVFGTILVIIFSIQPGNAVYRVMENRFSEGTIYGRIVVWEIAWKGFLNRSLLGWGPENFDLVFARHYNSCLGTVECAGEIWYDRAHNIVFDTLATTGVAGLMSYLAIFGAAIYVLWRKYFAGAIGFAQAGVFTALLAAYFVQNLTVFDMITSLMMFFLILGFIASLDSPEGKREEQRFHSLSFWKIGAVALAFAICFQCFVIGPYNADRNVILAAQSPLGSQTRLDFYKKTFDSSPMGEFQ
ncbi:MAG: O-antigen ligase family protein, partial [Candidatus Paceibacterota bacterium]